MAKKRAVDRDWAALFEEYDILNQVHTNGSFVITADQIRVYHEPRLMAKFDHRENLPEIMYDEGLSILPLSRSSYIILPFNAYHKLESGQASLEHAEIPQYIQSIDEEKITSEAVALNCAYASRIIANFLDDETMIPTVSGKMGTGEFSFVMSNSEGLYSDEISIKNSQMEIDAGFEGVSSLALIEAKNELTNDFLIRQIYFPYRVWKERVTKPVRPIFLAYSNGLYKLYEYEFTDARNYNSIKLVRHKQYSIENPDISIADIESVLHNVKVKAEPDDIPFPQADRFERIINLCEILLEQEKTPADVTDHYAFDGRQTAYYTNAARYLGLIDKTVTESKQVVYSISEKGRDINNLSYRKRQLAYCECILSYKAFNDTLRLCFQMNGEMPTVKEIIGIMKGCSLYKVGSEETFKRRASTISGWVNWILALINTP